MLNRLFDLVIAFSALVLFAPLLFIVSCLIFLKLGKPVFFTQVRPGRAGKTFLMVKFRTMLEAYDSEGNALPDAERMTPFGKFLRASSIDELPELLNVIKGDMSIVGPRPLLVEYLPLYSDEQKRRHEVRPGITGWAQINGRNAISWEDKFSLDVWYVDNHSIWLDLKIIFLTLKKVIIREGISGGGEVTMSKFTGSQK